jgi:hypothetical protein
MSSLLLCHGVAFDDTHNSQSGRYIFHLYQLRSLILCSLLGSVICYTLEQGSLQSGWVPISTSVLTACIKDKVHVVDHYPLCHHFGGFNKVHYMLDWFLSATKSWFSVCAQLLA